MLLRVRGGTYFFTARTLATARHRSASTASRTSRPCTHLERRDQPGQLTGMEQVIVRGRAPAELALDAQERLHHQQAARLDQLDHLGHLGPVKIIEHENRIKTAELRPRLFEVGCRPLDGQPLGLGPLATRGQPDLVLVDRRDPRALARRRRARGGPHRRRDRAPAPRDRHDDRATETRCWAGWSSRRGAWSRATVLTASDTRSAGGGAGRHPGDRRWHHRRRGGPRCRDAGTPGGAGGPERPRLGHQLTVQPPGPRRPALSRDRRHAPGAGGQPGAAHPAPHRARTWCGPCPSCFRCIGETGSRSGG